MTTANFSEIDTSKEDMAIITKIVDRYISRYPDDQPRKVDVQMDLTCVHYNYPLRLQELWNADDFNFFHDVNKIQSYLDRETGKLLYGFLPRFTK